MRIALGADHAGFLLKESLKDELLRAGHQVEDVGTDSTASVDYPRYAERVAERVASEAAERGILVCSTGVGMAISANKVAGIRAANVTDEDTARLSRQHNDANVLALGARTLAPDRALAIVRAWLEAQFEGGRHAQRVAGIKEIEKQNAEKRRTESDPS